MLDLGGFGLNYTDEIKNFLISISANLATEVIAKIPKESSSKTQRQLQKAFKKGLKGFVSTIDDRNVDLDQVEKLLAQESIKKLLIGSVCQKDSYDISTLESAIEAVGIDTGTINNFNLSRAICTFIGDFTTAAETSDELSSYLQLQYIKQIPKILGKFSPQLPKTSIQLQNLQEKYFNYLKEKHSPMSFRGFSEKMLPFSLNEIYTELVLTTSLPSDSKKYLRLKESFGKQNKEMANEEDGQIVDLSEILASDYAIITGDPGSGKTTLLRYLTLALIKCKGFNLTEADRPFFPILVPIAAYAENFKKNGLAYTFDKFIIDYFSCVDNTSIGELFEYEKKSKSVLYLFDGLDEVANENERTQLVSQIRDFIINHGAIGNRYLITCRTASYTRTSRFDPIGDNEFKHYKILPFGLKQINKFLLNWYRCYEKKINNRVDIAEKNAQKKAKSMMRVIANDKNIFSIAINPLMLTILALVEHEGGELPKNRAELYAKCLRLLSEAWNKLRSIHEGLHSENSLSGRRITEDFVIEHLGPVAFEMHTNSLPTIDYSDLKCYLVKSFDLRNEDLSKSREEAYDFIEIMKERSGLLQEVVPSVYGFLHLTFKEYLSARYLTDIVDDIFATLGNRVFIPEWKEVILLAVSSLKKRDATNFVHHIAKLNIGRHENLLLAAECIGDAGRDRIKDDIFNNIINDLRRVGFGEEPLDIRLEIAEALGRLGDSRDLKKFIYIPGGYYPISFNGKKYVASFEISKYPVTNCWFSEFVQADGYNTDEFWNQQGLFWKKLNNINEPKSWYDDLWNCPNSPVVNISWYEAEAFTNWLTVFLNDGYCYKLPSEDQWYASATGFEGREYPWGNNYPQDVHCNIEKSKIGRTSPVGLFGKGDTPNGIVDLGGNVWEWIQDDYYVDLYTDDKILKGGSWFTVPDAARCSYSMWWNPDIRHEFIGFRCIREKKLEKKAL